MAPPPDRWRSISAPSAEREAASRPFPGSSRSHRFAPLAAVRARSARLRWPVESIRTGTSTSGARPKRDSALSILSSSAPSTRDHSARASRNRCPASRAGCSSAKARVPSNRTCPDAQGSSPAIIRSRLDLPTPLGPRTRRLSPAATANESSVKTSRPPRTQLTSSTLSISGAALQCRAVVMMPGK